MPEPLTVGVEEEFFVVDAQDRRPRNDTTALLDAVHRLPGGRDSYSAELRTCMLESRTGICHTLDQVRGELRELRAGLVQAARQTGSRVVAAATLAQTDWRTQKFVEHPRNHFILDRYAYMARTHVMCACQVHVGVADRDTAIQVANRVRPWLPVLHALAASSPFWMGEDTGFASYRGTVWENWPTGGMPPAFSSYDDYGKRMAVLVNTGTIHDIGQVYWDVRPGTNYQTVEFRPADSCTTVDDTVLQAGLCRALVQHALGEIERGIVAPELSHEMLRAAKWRAARYGLTADLLDPVEGELAPAKEMLDRLLRVTEPALEQAGDLDEVTELVERKKIEGTSAERQRAVLAGGGTFTDVVDLLARQTAEP
ncbi:carboxylate-amine ligase [Actinophytocola oryzae]|uniref:Putative glutamate--cysteine ligase 2 n=1 Tax=Actinophytocola oryzae TaxID=502181 RepID=A0A4R7VR06_9PSEU|nr:glutamate--cysteine ligase [Actinophytocola oryzae]TDV51885.1 carboxylate-amine ligase [Actinophytocola oryzae]